jgi:hypothetical protein
VSFASTRFDRSNLWPFVGRQCDSVADPTLRHSFSVCKELPKTFDDIADPLAGLFVLSSDIGLGDTQNQNLMRDFLSFITVAEAFGLMGKIGGQGAIELLLWDEDRPSHDPGYWLLIEPRIVRRVGGKRRVGFELAAIEAGDARKANFGGEGQKSVRDLELGDRDT